LCKALLEAVGALDKEAAQRPVSPLSSRPASPPLRILLVEDNIVNQRVGTFMLQKAGHTVTVAGNGRQALEMLARAEFDVVLLDVQMPEMDGLETIAEIRRREQGTGRHLPVVALTAHALQGDRERCLAAGMDGYVSKPLRAEELLAVFRELVQR
jgi:CheY-like chemotaxis protein